MTRKALRIVLFFALAAMVAITSGAVVASTKAKAQLPEYVGSQACLGCHVDEFLKWSTSDHSEALKVLMKPDDLPLDITSAPPELQAELAKAQYTSLGGRRFLIKNPETHELTYLNVQYDAATNSYAAYKGGGNWEASCSGCHSGRYELSSAPFNEPGIGCEACHGPGRDHIQGKGKISLITASTSSESCGQCHSGYNGNYGTVEGVTRWPAGYRPGMDLSQVEGFKLAVFDPNAAPPQKNPAGAHKQQYPMWAASAHATSTDIIIGRGDYYMARSECVTCHSTDATLRIKSGETWDPKTLISDGVSCVACHDPHGATENPAQLKMNAQDLCVSCHSVGRDKLAPAKIGTVRAPHAPQADMLWGTGALGGVTDTTGAHTGVTCIECHMTEGNHMMKVIKPEDVIGTTRTDSCVACHANSSAESRGVYLELWQESVKSRLAVIEVNVTAIEERLKANPSALTAEQLKSFQEWRANFWYVRKDGSFGAHNFEYAIKVLSQTQKEIANLKAAMQ